jgi:hypothetical protein
MSQKPDGGQAFPRPATGNAGGGGYGVGGVEPHSPGMTLRDWFAGHALTGCISATAHPNSAGPGTTSKEDWARLAYEMADAMLAERAK